MLINATCFKQFNESSFVNELLSSGILEVETLDDPNIALAHLTSILKCTLHKHTPIKRKKVKLSKQPEWITDTILDAIKQCDYWFRKKDFNQYRKCRNLYNSMIKNAKKNYFNNAITEMKNKLITNRIS